MELEHQPIRASSPGHGRAAQRREGQARLLSESFSTLLRRHRLAAALTQERLAERAGISVTGIAALERGRRRAPRLSTVRLIAEALSLDAGARAELTAAAVEAVGAGPAAATPESPSPTGGPASRAAIPSMAPPPRRHDLVGRAHELVRMQAAWENRARLVMLSGEEGIGKTRLASELATEVRDCGATVLWGRCSSEQLGPYEPFVAVARHVLTELDGAARRAAVAGRGDLARLVPEVAALVPGLPSPTQADAGTERRLLFESFAGLLRAVTPALLVVDDLHWADSLSVALLDDLVRRHDLDSLVVLGTVRTTELDEPRAARLAALGRDTTSVRIRVVGLDEAGTASLVQQVAGGVPSTGLVRAVVQACGGNPFFVEELTEHILEANDGPPAHAAVPAPARVKETLFRRVACLSSDARALLRAGAVLGRQFEPGLAGELAGLDDAGTVASVEDALLSGLVVESSVREIAFSHALVQSAIYGDLSSLRRVQIHRKAARALEDRAGQDPAMIADIARHWAAVAEVDDEALSSAARWAVRAGDAALAVAATEEAIARYEQASRWWSVSTADHADALIRLGRALLSSGRVDDADDRFRAALHLAEGLDDPVLRARASLGLGSTIHFGRIDSERIDALERALSALDDDHGDLRVAASAMLMRLLAFDRSPAATTRRHQVVAEILAAVDRPDADPDDLMALGAARDAVPVDDPVSLDRVTKRIIAVAGERRDVTAAANAWYGQAWSALERAHAGDWEAAVHEYAGHADVLQLPFEMGVAAMLRGADAQMKGRYGDARRFLQEVRGHGERGNDPNVGFVTTAQSLLLGIDQGRVATMLPKMQAVGEDYKRINTSRSGLALVAALAGDERTARSVLDEFAAERFQIRWDSEWPATVAFLSHASVLLDDPAYAAPLYQVLAGTPVRGIRVAPLAGWWGPVDHHLGALSTVLGELDRACEHLERALDTSRAMGAAPFEARTRLALAGVFERRGHPGDRAAARAARDDAVAMADRLEAEGIVAEAAR